MNMPGQDPTASAPAPEGETGAQDPAATIDAIIAQLNDLKTQLSGEEQQETPEQPAGQAAGGGKPYGKASRGGLSALLGG
jgi:hypothetical protein